MPYMRPMWELTYRTISSTIFGLQNDIALIAESEEEHQTRVDNVHHSSSTFGLKINTNN